ncbi:C-X-C motif chemokine 10-like [Chanos chanos]|uniref:C-X-C motif chemokine 10-like n=1 Tax=Chanos chanos TaxID=29144 RepID=A0A6J2WRG5_CHACN|nr:C-X-C motif chemokine 10-like [Chanos chanos]
MRALTLTLLCVVALTVSLSQCEARGRTDSTRCLCGGKPRARVKFGLIKKIDVYPPSNSCPDFEIVIIPKKGQPFCLDRSKKQGTRILEKMKQRKEPKRRQGKNKKRD